MTLLKTQKQKLQTARYLSFFESIYKIKNYDIEIRFGRIDESDDCPCMLRRYSPAVPERRTDRSDYASHFRFVCWRRGLGWWGVDCRQGREWERRPISRPNSASRRGPAYPLPGSSPPPITGPRFVSVGRHGRYPPTIDVAERCILAVVMRDSLCLACNEGTRSCLRPGSCQKTGAAVGADRPCHQQLN